MCLALFVCGEERGAGFHSWRSGIDCSCSISCCSVFDSVSCFGSFSAAPSNARPPGPRCVRTVSKTTRTSPLRHGALSVARKRTPRKSAEGLRTEVTRRSNPALPPRKESLFQGLRARVSLCETRGLRQRPAVLIALVHLRSSSFSILWRKLAHGAASLTSSAR